MMFVADFRFFVYLCKFEGNVILPIGIGTWCCHKLGPPCAWGPCIAWAFRWRWTWIFPGLVLMQPGCFLDRFFFSNGQWSWFRTKKLLLRKVCMIVAYWSRSCEEGPGLLKYFVWTRHNPYSTTCRIGTLQRRMHYFGRVNGTLTMIAWNPMKIQNHINTWYKKPSWQVVTLAVMWFRRVSNTAWKHPMVGSRKMEVGWFWIILMFLDVLIVTSSTLETGDDSTDLWKMSFWCLQWMMESEELSGLSYASPSVV